MTNAEPTMKALRLETYGKPLDVLRLEDVPFLRPALGRFVHACMPTPIILQTRLCLRAFCPVLLHAALASMFQGRWMRSVME